MRNCWFTNVPLFSNTVSVGNTTFAAALVARGVTAVADRQRVLVTLPDDRDVIDSRAVFDAVRDVAVLRDTALLRMERRRGHLEDLFTLTS